jgi:hypothetical protein
VSPDHLDLIGWRPAAPALEPAGAPAASTGAEAPGDDVAADAGAVAGRDQSAAPAAAAAPSKRAAAAGRRAAMGAAAWRAALLQRTFPSWPPLPPGARTGPGPLPCVAAAEEEAVLGRTAPPAPEWLEARRGAVEALGLRLPGWGEHFDAAAWGGGGGRGLVPCERLRAVHPDDPVYL